MKKMPALQKNPEMTGNVFDKAEEEENEAMSKKGIYFVLFVLIWTMYHHNMVDSISFIV